MSPKRVFRFIGARSCPADGVKLLAAVPIFAGESLDYLSMRFVGVSTTSKPYHLPELNWVGLFVPWAVAFTHRNDTFEVDELETADEWSELFQNLVYEFGTDRDEFYGGESIQGTADDVIPEPGAMPDDGTDHDEPLVGLPNPYDGSAKGPMGIVRLFSEETWCYPVGNADTGGNNASHASYFNFHNKFSGAAMNAVSGGIVLAGCVRFETSPETNFGVEFSGTNERKGFGALIGGDLTRVQQIIASDTTELGDHMRTILFGGDTYNEGYLSVNSVITAVKGLVKVNTPYIR